MVLFDRFTKVLLVVIAISLGIIALRPIFHSEVVQANSGQFDHLTMSFVTGGFYLFDPTDGNVWHYSHYEGDVEYVGKLIQPGKPLQR